MILSSDVYLTLLTAIRKDARGRSISPEEFNHVARLVNKAIFSKYYAEFEENVESSDTLGKFRVISEAVAIAGGVGTLPVNYHSLVGMPYYTDAGGVTRYIDLVSDLEYAKRQKDYLTQATLTHPVCRLGLADANADMTIHVAPTAGINPIYMDYLRKPDTPYLDYYVNDTTLVYTWMAADTNMTVPSGSTARDGSVGVAVVASDTVNFEWDDDEFPMIINLFLKYVGIQLPDQILFEGGTLLEEKIENQ